MGDAAHGVHPIAGQGLNQGLRDIAALTEVVVKAHRSGQDIGGASVLDQYQIWRRFDANVLAAATDGINNLFSNANPILRPIRHLGMAAVNAIPTVRRSFLREAAGFSGDVPVLMQGRLI